MERKSKEIGNTESELTPFRSSESEVLNPLEFKHKAGVNQGKMTR